MPGASFFDASYTVNDGMTFDNASMTLVANI